MEEQVSPSNYVLPPQPAVGQITPEQLEELKTRAREAAIFQVMQQRQEPLALNQPQIVYVKKPFTLAEIIVVLAISCGIVFGIQTVGSFVWNRLPQIEIKMK